jgi:hypothetical protein
LPADLQVHVDDVVKQVLDGITTPKRPSFDLVTSWCEVHEDESGLQSCDYGDSFLLVAADEGLPSCSDEECDLEADPAGLSDQDRVAYIREYLHKIFDGATDEAELYPYACVLRIEASDGTQACLAYFVSGGGMGGVEIRWLGAYRSFNVFRSGFRESGAFTSYADVEAASDDRLLRCWRFVE